MGRAFPEWNVIEGYGDLGGGTWGKIKGTVLGIGAGILVGIACGIVGGVQLIIGRNIGGD